MLVANARKGVRRSVQSGCTADAQVHVNAREMLVARIFAVVGDGVCNTDYHTCQGSLMCSIIFVSSESSLCVIC